MKQQALEDYLTHELDQLQRKGLFRSLKPLENIGPIANYQGREVILLCSNSYLGLHRHPRVIEAAREAMDRFGSGSAASRLISGNLILHQELERRIAAFKGYPAALLFSTGYMANLGLISSLCDSPQDLIISDQLNHASIIDACRLSRAQRVIYRHRDMEHLKEILSRSQGYQRRWIITEGVFSMDGDLAPLPEILQLAREFEAQVIIDDAHGLGILGKNGRGTLEYYGLEDSSPIQTGTLSKALGNLGGFVVGSERLIAYLHNRARSFIYSTALPPAVVAGALTALEIIDTQPQLREQLWIKVNHLRKCLLELGFNLMDSQTHIIPLLIGDLEKSVNFSNALLELGVYAPAIRPPTVPVGKCRLRISIMASHTFEHLERAINALKIVGKRLRVI